MTKKMINETIGEHLSTLLAVGAAVFAIAAVVARPSGSDVPNCATLVDDGLGVLEDGDGKITDPKILEQLKTFLQGFVAFAR